MKKETPLEKLLHGFKFGCRLIFPLHGYFKYSSTQMCAKGNEVSNLGQKTHKEREHQGGPLQPHKKAPEGTVET